MTYTLAMILSFKSKSLKRFATQGDHSKLSVPNIARVERVLQLLNAATQPEQMNLPGYRFHQHKGVKPIRYSVDVSGSWRILFSWNGNDAIDVDLEDPH